jgi:hypothetical protein
MHSTSYLESFEQNLIEKYQVQIHMNARIAFGEDRFWDVTDPYSPVRSGTAYEAFHLFIEKSTDESAEKDTFRTILQELNLVDSLIEVTQLKNEDLISYLEDKEKLARYVEVDYAIIACTFAQIVKFGIVSDGFMKLFIISILRQLNPILNEFVCKGNQDEIDRRCNLIEDLSKFVVNIVKAVR